MKWLDHMYLVKDCKTAKLSSKRIEQSLKILDSYDQFKDTMKSKFNSSRIRIRVYRQTCHQNILL